MKPKYKIRKTKKKIHWHLHVTNSDALLSSDMYDEKSEALYTLEICRILSQSPNNYMRHEKNNGVFYFTLMHRDMIEVARSGDYESKQDMESDILAAINSGGTDKIKDMS